MVRKREDIYLENHMVIQGIVLVRPKQMFNWQNSILRFLTYFLYTKNIHNLIRAGTTFFFLPFVAPLLRNQKISKRISLLNRRLPIKLIGRRDILLLIKWITCACTLWVSWFQTLFSSHPIFTDLHQHRWAVTQQNYCAPSEDSDQPGHPPSLIRGFAVRMKKAWVLSYPLSV